MKRFHNKVNAMERSFDEIIGIIREGNEVTNEVAQDHGIEKAVVDRFIDMYKSYYSKNGAMPTYRDMVDELGISLDEVDEIYSILKSGGQGK